MACPHRVDLDPAFVLVPAVTLDIQVADRRERWCPTVLDFLERLALDVVTLVAGLVLIDDSQHALEHAAGGRLIDTLHAGDQYRSGHLQTVGDGGIVEAISREAAELVHDDVIDISLLSYSLDQRQHGRTLIDSRAGVFVDVLIDDYGAELLGPQAARRSLGRQRISFRVPVSLGLRFGAHPNVDNRSTL